MHFYEYTGCLHVHTTYSDGEGCVADVAEAARRAGVDFVVVNDHAHMTSSIHREEEAFYGDVLVMMDLEVGVRYNHYLAFDCRRMPEPRLAGGQEIIDEVAAAGGFGFLSHPFEKGMPLAGSVAYTWNDLDATGFTGICFWNFSSRWKERISGPVSGLVSILFKSGLLRGPCSRTMTFWDSLCAQRRVSGIGGSDAHHWGYGVGPFRLRPLTYKYLLGAITSHVLLDAPLPRDVAGARVVICRALREGSIFVANDKIGDSRGFRLHFEADGGGFCGMGAERNFSTGVLDVKVPREGEIRLIRNGVVADRFRGTEKRIRIDSPGVYRIEVYRRKSLFGDRPWIFSNPVYLRP